MTNCTITLDVTGFGYTYLLQLDAMLGDFLEDGDNAAAADTLHDWIAENARNFTDDARANGDTLAADIFSDMAAEAEGGNDPEEDDDEEEPDWNRDAYTLPADDETAFKISQIAIRDGRMVTIEPKTNAGGYTTQLVIRGDAEEIEDLLAAANEEPALDASETAALDAVTMYLGDEGNEPLREAIEVAAENCKRDANDIFAAGRFEGAAAMLAAQIWATGASHGATRAQMIEATYRAYGVAW